MSGLDEQQLGQRHAPLLAARQLRHIGVARRAAQRVQRLLHLGVEVPQALRLDLVLQLGHLLGGLVGVVGGDLVVAVDQRLLLRHALHGVAQHVLDRVELRLLGQVADAHAVGRPGLAEEVLELAGHDLQQVDLPAPFKPTTPILAPGKNDSEMSFEHLLAPRIGLGELVHVIDVLGVRHRATPCVTAELGVGGF